MAAAKPSGARQRPHPARATVRELIMGVIYAESSGRPNGSGGRRERAARRMQTRSGGIRTMRPSDLATLAAAGVMLAWLADTSSALAQTSADPQSAPAGDVAQASPAPTQPTPAPADQNAPQSPSDAGQGQPPGNPPAATTPPNAEAQAAPAGAGLQEVVVTARYRQETLQTTPLAISAITSQDIQSRSFVNSTDVVATVPNAVFRPAQAAFGNTQTAFIRGIGQADFNFAFEPGVAIYVDDVYYPTTMSSQFDLIDVDRVEVLRGPQGTLFGRGAIGGAVRYVSKDPTGDNAGYAEATVGDFHRVDVLASYDFTVVPDMVFARVTGVSRKQDGYQTDIDFACAYPQLAGSLPALSHNRLSGCNIGSFGGTDVAGARGMFRFVITDNIDDLLSVDFQRDDSEARADTLMGIGPVVGGFAAWSQAMQNGTIPPPPGSPPGTPAVRPNPGFFGYGVPFDSRFIPPNPYISYATYTDPYTGLHFNPQTALNQKGFSDTFNLKFSSALNLKFITAWRNWNGYFATDQADAPLALSIVDGRQTFTYRTDELRFFGRLFDRLDWTAGAFYYSGNWSSAQEVQLPGSLSLYPLDYPAPALGSSLFNYLAHPTGYAPSGVPYSLLVNGLDVGHAENESAYANAVFSITKTLRVSLGARFSHDKKSDHFDNTIVTGAVINVSDDVGDWMVSLDDQVTDSTLAYVRAASGYRPAAFNPRPFQASQFVGVPGEKAVAYEIGAKNEFLERRARVNLAAFYTDYKQHIIAGSGAECLKTPAGQVIPGPLPNPEGGPTCLANTLPLTAYLNSPARIWGGELEFAGRPFGGLQLNGSAGYTRMSSDTVLFQGHPYNGITPNGQFAGVPRWTGSWSAQYAIALPNGATITPRYDGYMNTQICGGVPNYATGYTALSSCVGGYVTHNVRLEYSGKDDMWNVAVGLTNATNHFYWLNNFDLTGFGEPTIEGQPVQPRAWYLTVRRQF
jgi:iron complex outermembrane recepter protein